MFPCPIYPGQQRLVAKFVQKILLGGLYPLSEYLVTYQFFRLLIPQTKIYGLEAFPEGQFGNLLEKGFSTVASLQMVVWDSGAEMMDMVVADITREPVHDGWKFIK